MNRSSASAYAYAKASGILVKSYAGDNASLLFNAKSLAELWELIFHTNAPSVPEVLLANNIENEAMKRFVNQYTHLLDAYDSPDSYLIELIRRYEIENLKVIAASLSLGEEKMPRTVDIGDYSFLHYNEWPNLSAITKGTRYEWYNDASAIEKRAHLDYLLDAAEIKTLWASLDEISDGSKNTLKKFFIEEYSVKNMQWALRLKVYYKFSRERIIESLFCLGDKPSPSDKICPYAFEILDKDVDSYEDWESWRFAKFLNSHTEGEVWSVNPRRVEHCFKFLGWGKARKMFHLYPMTDISMVMFFFIKQQELNCIRAATERLRLGASVSEAMYVAGVRKELDV